MTPGPWRPEALQRRLVEMRGLLTLLHRHRDIDGAELRDHLERRLAIERALQQLVDLAVKINAHVATAAGQPAPVDYHSSFAAAATSGAISDELARGLAPPTGLRNRLVHGYEEVDLDLVAASLPGAVDGYDAYVRQVATWLQDR